MGQSPRDSASSFIEEGHDECTTVDYAMRGSYNSQFAEFHTNSESD